MSPSAAHLDAAPARRTLWPALVAPMGWALHFLASYVTLALSCARPDLSFVAARGLVLLYTALAFALFAAVAWRATVQLRAAGVESTPPADRFMASLVRTTAAMSAIATAFVAMPMLFFEGCQ